MISRSRCKRIAREWVSNEGIAEYQRRMEDVSASQREYGLPYDSQLVKDATGMMFRGYYDPPTPRIPNLFRRLRMNDWTPARRTDDMYTGPGTRLYGRRHPEVTA